MDKFTNSRSLMSLNEFLDKIYQVEKIKTFLFFIFLHAELTGLQIKNKFFPSFCNSNRYELIETYTDSLYMAISEEKPDEIIRPDRRLL